MDALDGPVLFRVADATGDLLFTIAQLASVSRAFAHVARSELWPRYCLARATGFAKESEVAAVAAAVERLVREASSADAPQNAAISLARCMSACPGVAHACSIALRVNAAPLFGPGETGRWSVVDESGMRAASGSGASSVEGGTEWVGEAGNGGSAASGGCNGAAGSPTARGAIVSPTDHPRAATPTTPLTAPTAASPPPVDPHIDECWALCCDLAAQIFVSECFLPAPSSSSSLVPPRAPDSTSYTFHVSPIPLSTPFPRPSRGGGEEGGESEEGVGEGAQERAAVLMPTRRCGWEHSVAGEPCCVLQGAIAGFKHSRFHWLLQGQPFSPNTCPFCHDQAWNATALLNPTAHIALGCSEDDVCCFICTQGHLFGVYKSPRTTYSGDDPWYEVEHYRDFDDDDDDGSSDGSVEVLEQRIGMYGIDDPWF